MLPKRREPTHPGSILLEDFLKPKEISPKQFATTLGSNWTEEKIQDIIKGKESISDKTAEAFASALGTSAHFWKHLQEIFNKWHSNKKHNEKGAIKPWKKTA